MKKIIIYRCEDSIDGIFTAIYDAWDSKYGHDFIKLEVNQKETYSNIELFSDYITVNTDLEKSLKVSSSIQTKISMEVYERVVNAALSNDARKADCIYHFLVLGFSMGSRVINHLANPYVQTLFEINRNVSNEIHLYKGFLRFMEVQEGFLLAKFEPKNSLVQLITPHFADRLSTENFMILDVNRRLASVHQKGDNWILIQLDDSSMEKITSYTEEEEYQSLWKAFFKSINIEERENYNCQRNHAPLHFRKYMLEFDQKAK